MQSLVEHVNVSFFPKFTKCTGSIFSSFTYFKVETDWLRIRVKCEFGVNFFLSVLSRRESETLEKITYFPCLDGEKKDCVCRVYVP